MVGTFPRANIIYIMGTTKKRRIAARSTSFNRGSAIPITQRYSDTTTLRYSVEVATISILCVIEILQISIDKTKHKLLFYFNPRCLAAQLTPHCVAKIGIILEMTKKKVKKVKLVRKIYSFV